MCTCTLDREPRIDWQHKTKDTDSKDGNSKILMDNKTTKNNTKMERRVEDIMLEMLKEWRKPWYRSSEFLITKLLEMYHPIETLFIAQKYSIFVSFLSLLLPHRVVMEAPDHL